MSKREQVRYELFYWPEIQGRGEFVRLAFEEAGAPYVDVARLSREEGGGVPVLMEYLEGKRGGAQAPFAPPFLKVGDLVIAQTAAILEYIAPRLGLVPEDETSRVRANQLQLTIADLVVEAHDVHHPIGAGLYYEDQKPESKRRAQSFTTDRIPKFLGYFERILERGGASAFLLGGERSYVDLSLFQVIAGLRYAFPKTMKHVEKALPRTSALHDRIAARPNIAAYLASPRRLPFNPMGIFRHYAELDVG
jgi:glutathione S-transferase